MTFVCFDSIAPPQSRSTIDCRITDSRLFQTMQYFKLEITINSDGSVVETVIAGAGSDCDKLTKELNDAIGSTESQKLLPEYFLEDDDNSSLTTNY